MMLNSLPYRTHSNGISMLVSVRCLSLENVQYLLQPQNIWLSPEFNRNELLQSFHTKSKSIFRIWTQQFSRHLKVVQHLHAKLKMWLIITYQYLTKHNSISCRKKFWPKKKRSSPCLQVWGVKNERSYTFGTSNYHFIKKAYII